MTPAITAARRAKIDFTVHEYPHDPASSSFGMEAAEKLGVEPLRIFKTLVVALDNGQLVVAALPVVHSLDLKALATHLQSKRAILADPAEAERATGYVVGGISPLGQKKRLPMVLDQSALEWEQIYVSAGRRGLEISLMPEDLIRLCAATVAPISRHSGT